MIGRAVGEGQCLVFLGDPGIGKSTLLRAAQDIARGAGFRVLSAAGVESEAQLPFAGRTEPSSKQRSPVWFDAKWVR